MIHQMLSSIWVEMAGYACANPPLSWSFPLRDFREFLRDFLERDLCIETIKMSCIFLALTFAEKQSRRCVRVWENLRWWIFRPTLCSQRVALGLDSILLEPVGRLLDFKVYGKSLTIARFENCEEISLFSAATSTPATLREIEPPPFGIGTITVCLHLFRERCAFAISAKRDFESIQRENAGFKTSARAIGSAYLYSIDPYFMGHTSR
jgi:hypothetical protein